MCVWRVYHGKLICFFQEFWCDLTMGILITDVVAMLVAPEKAKNASCFIQIRVFADQNIASDLSASETGETLDRWW